MVCNARSQTGGDTARRRPIGADLRSITSACARAITSITSKGWISALRRAVRGEQFQPLKALLQRLGILAEPRVKRALDSRNLNELTAALGEAIQRNQLLLEHAHKGGISVLPNVEVVSRMAAFDSTSQCETRRARAPA